MADTHNANTYQSLISTREQLIAATAKLTLFSDAFMSVALQDIPACQHVLRILTGIQDLIVKNVVTQYTVSKIISHDARLDIFAEDKRGRLHNIEIQRSDTVDHPRRVRFYGAMIDSEFLLKGKEYSELPEVHLIYISEKDIMKGGRTVYPVEKSLGGTGQLYDDGLHILYVNAEIDDGTEISELMKYFKTASANDMSQGDLSARVHFLKCNEGGHDIMCEFSDMLIQAGRQEGQRETKRLTALNLANMGMAIDFIAKAVNESTDLVAYWLQTKPTANP